ncbi:MAG: hypothetical protein M3T56_00600 [Chloroflexota bacterium]|nr:hypothetical protein [Chloroflexota bacterium]
MGGLALVFSIGVEVNGRVILPSASKDDLGLKNAHIYRHTTLGDFVAFAVDYQDLGGDTLERQGWQLDPYLRPALSLHVALDGTILWFDEEREEVEGQRATPNVMGRHTELKLIGPAPVCFQCENVHAEGPEAAHSKRQAEIQEKLDSMLGKGWDADLDDEDDQHSGDAQAEVRSDNAASQTFCTWCHHDYDPHGSDASRHQAIADFQIMTLAQDRKPRWDAGFAHIDGLARTQMRDWPNQGVFTGPPKETLRESGHATRQAFWAKQLNGALEQVQKAWSKRTPHFMKILAVRDADLLITGGYMTDCSTRTRGEPGATILVRILEASGVSRTVGFDD